MGWCLVSSLGSWPEDDEVRPCRAVVAASGYGKTRRQAAEGTLRTAYHPAGSVVAGTVVLDRLPDGTLADLVVVDGLDDLPVAAQRGLARRLGEVRPRTGISLLSRVPLHPDVRAALRRPVIDVAASELALDFAAVDEVLRDDHSLDDRDLTATVLDLTCGWPTLVHRAAELARAGSTGRAELLVGFGAIGSAGAAWVESQILAGLTSPTRCLLDLMRDLPTLNEDLVTALGGSVASFELLRLVGVLVPEGSDSRLVPLIGSVLRTAHRSGDTDDDRRRLAAAAQWYAAHGHPVAAADALLGAGDRSGCHDLIATRGEEMLARGGAPAVVRLLEGVSRAELEEVQLRDLLLVFGDAQRLVGDTTGAQRTFARLLPDGPGDPCDPGLVWRVAALHYSRAEYAETVRRCLAPVTASGSDRWWIDTSRRLAVLASARFMLGDVEEGAAEARTALELAAGLDHDSTIAAAHLVCALTTTGARRDNHLAAALNAAERAGDVVLVARALLNQADNLLCGADYARALEVGQAALSVGDACPPGTFVSALNTVGEALIGLGRFEEARVHFERSLGISRRCGLARTGGALHGLAEVEHQLGRVERSRAAYEEVVQLARDTGEQQVLVPALARLALLVHGDEQGEEALERALALADEALRLAAPEYASGPLVARATLALAAGDEERASRLAQEAVAVARRTRQQAALAVALEFAATVSTDDAATEALTEALLIWERGSSVVAARRVRSALEALSAVGVQIRVLGGFEVLVDGEPVPVPAWRSRQARSLLKILAARHGRPLSRGELCEQLWPDDDPQRTGHRLSVLISAVRNVLDPDKRRPPDHYLAADLMGLRLDVTRVHVDSEQFVRDADRATALAEVGDEQGARRLLADLATTYKGDAFEDEPYEEWAAAVREELRAIWLHSLRLAANLSGRAGDIDQAVTYLVRILGADGYDEVTHRTLVQLLVRVGRHGEARRAYGRWVRAMEAIEATRPDARVLMSC